MVKKITKKMKFSEILDLKPEAGEILFESGMMCFGCPMASMETLEEGCNAHGLSKKEIEEIVKRINLK
jgi:hybrid cluster-associated redox disulfide protein